MPCATIAEALHGQQKSVMRSTELKTRGAGEIVAMATGLWEGSWDEILQCPRKHKEAVPASTTPNHPPPTIGAFQRTPRPVPRKRKTKVITISDSSNSSGAVLPGPLKTGFTPNAEADVGVNPPVLLKPGASLRSSPRKLIAQVPSTQQGASMRIASGKVPASASTKENHSPAKNLRSTSRAQATVVAEEDLDVGFADPAIVSCAPGPTRAFWDGSSSENSSCRNTYSGFAGTRSSGPDSGYASAKSQQSRLASRQRMASAGSTHRQANHARNPNQTTAPPRRRLLRSINELVGWSDGLWFIFQQALIGVCIILGPCMYSEVADDIHDWSDIFVAHNRWAILQFLCTVLVVAKVVSYTMDRVRSFVWRRYAIDISPLEVPQTASYMVYLGFACFMACVVRHHRARHALSLISQIASRYPAQEATRVELPGSDEAS